MYLARVFFYESIVVARDETIRRGRSRQTVVKRLENLRNLRLENLELQHDGWVDFATAMPVVSARGSGLDPGISRSDGFEDHSPVIPGVLAGSGMDHAASYR